MGTSPFNMFIVIAFGEASNIIYRPTTWVIHMINGNIMFKYLMTCHMVVWKQTFIDISLKYFKMCSYAYHAYWSEI